MTASSSSQVRTVAVGGQPLRVAVRSGDPGRTPLLLLNGIGVGLEAFGPFVEALDPAIPVIRFDPPGVGGSPLPAAPYRLPGLARIVLAPARCPRPGAGRCPGHLLGRRTGPAVRPHRWPPLPQTRAGRDRHRLADGARPHPRVLAQMATPRRHLDPDHMRRVAAEIYGGSARTDPRLAPWLLHTHSRVGPRRGYYYQLLAGAGWTSIPFLPLLRQPTLVLTGDDDPLIPTINGRLLAALIPRARLHVYPGGHLELAARPGLLVPVIEEFLHDTSADRPPSSGRRTPHDRGPAGGHRRCVVHRLLLPARPAHRRPARLSDPDP